MVRRRPLISVIVPAYNEEKYIRACLDSLTNQDLPKRFFEIIVVDNNSTDKTKEIIKKFPVKYTFEEKRNVVAAKQRGVKIAKGKIIASADADTFYPKSWLSDIKKHSKITLRLLLFAAGSILKTHQPFSTTQ